MPYPSSIANDTSSGAKLVRSAAQALKLSPGIIEIDRLIQPNFAAHQDLVGTDNERVSMLSRYLQRLGFGEGKRTVCNSPPIGLKDPLGRFFIHLCGFDLNFEAGIRKQLLPGRARRGENQLLTHPSRAVAPTIS